MGGGYGAMMAAGVGSMTQMLGALFSHSMSKKEAKRARKFIEYMASTAYQRTVKDMRLAGLNPILAATQGPTPSGTTAMAPAMQNPMAGAAGTALNAYRAARMIESEIKILKNQEEESYHRVSKVAADAGLAEDQAALARSQRNLNEIEATLRGTAVPAAKAQEELDKTQMGEYLRKLNRLIRSVLGADQTTAR